jgi:hypothetical protein
VIHNVKNGEKVLLAIGIFWTLGLGTVVAFSEFHKGDLGPIILSLLVIWTVVAFAWLLIYGRHKQ